MKKSNKKGFTIVELVIVIAVIGILAAVLVPTFSGVMKNAKQSAAVQKARAAYIDKLAEDAEAGEVTLGYSWSGDGFTVVFDANGNYTVSEGGSVDPSGSK